MPPGPSWGDVVTLAVQLGASAARRSTDGGVVVGGFSHHASIPASWVRCHFGRCLGFSWEASRGSWRLVWRCPWSLLERRGSVFGTHGASWRLPGAHTWVMGWKCRRGDASSGALLGGVLLASGALGGSILSPLGAFSGCEGGLPRVLRDVLEPSWGPVWPSGAFRGPRKRE